MFNFFCHCPDDTRITLVIIWPNNFNTVPDWKCRQTLTVIIKNIIFLFVIRGCVLLDFIVRVSNPLRTVYDFIYGIGNLSSFSCLWSANSSSIGVRRTSSNAAEIGFQIFQVQFIDLLDDLFRGLSQVTAIFLTFHLFQEQRTELGHHLILSLI